MSKFIQKYRKLLLVLIIIILIILIFLIIFFLKSSNKKELKKENGNYNISNKIEELPGTEKYVSDNLTSKHCIDRICVDNVTLYYDDNTNEGRLECRISNINKKVKSGYLKLVFDSESIIVVYDKLKPGEVIQTSAQFDNKKLEDVDKYKLKKLTKEELSKIKK